MAGNHRSAPVFSYFPPTSPPAPFGSYFYLRGELECCQIVILLLRCGFIHSFDSPQASARVAVFTWLAYGIRNTPFPPPLSFCACVNLHTQNVAGVKVPNPTSTRTPRFLRNAVCFLFCHAPFSRVRTEQMFYLNAHYYYFISTGDRLRGCVFCGVHQAKMLKSFPDDPAEDFVLLLSGILWEN